MELISNYSLQDIRPRYKSQLPVYTPAMNNLLFFETKKHNTIYISTQKRKKRKICRYKANKLYTRFIGENYKILKKEIKDLNKWKHILCINTWRGGLHTVEMPVLPNIKYKFKAIPIKIPAILWIWIAQHDIEEQSKD